MICAFSHFSAFLGLARSLKTIASTPRKKAIPTKTIDVMTAPAKRDVGSSLFRNCALPQVVADRLLRLLS
jgi:hypothetical protein